MVSTADPLSITHADLRIRQIGEPSILSPMAGLVQGRVSSPHYVHESDRVLLDDTVGRAAAEGTHAFVSGPYRFEVMPGVGHFIADQAPDRLNELLLVHVARHPV